jgi:hypothetical protein
MGDITQTVIAETIIYGRRETKFVEGRANSTQIKLIIPVRFICVSAENTTVTLEELPVSALPEPMHWQSRRPYRSYLSVKMNSSIFVLITSNEIGFTK